MPGADFAPILVVRHFRRVASAEVDFPLTTTKKPVRRVSRAAPVKAARAATKTSAVRKAPANPRGTKSGTDLSLPSTPRKRSKPEIEQDVAARLHAVVKTALEDLKAKDVREIDVRGKTSITDLVVVASGTSTRHVKSIADEVVKAAKKAGLPPIGVEGQREAEWVLVDLGDIVVHVMLPRTREFYGLERLWTVGDDEHPEKLAG